VQLAINSSDEQPPYSSSSGGGSEDAATDGTDFSAGLDFHSQDKRAERNG